MRFFKHLEVKSLEKSTALLRDFNGKAKLIAGGTDLLDTLKHEILPDYPEAIINIKTIPDLDYIKKEGDVLKIGTLVRLSALAASPLIKAKYKLLADAAESVASPVIRKMATLGGNLCQDVRCWYYRYPNRLGQRLMCYRKGSGSCLAVAGDNRYHAIMAGKGCFAVCPSDMAVALTALDAKINVVGSAGNRTVSIGKFYTPLGNILEPDEMLKEIQVHYSPKGAKHTFLKFSLRKPIDFSIVSVASVITVKGGICTDARIVLGAVAPTPIRATGAEEAIIGTALDGTSAGEAAKAAVVGAKPLSMNAYKVEITKTLVKRAILSSL